MKPIAHNPAMRNWYFGSLVIAILFGLFGGLLVFNQYRGDRRIGHALDKIEKGMTEQEVQDLIGIPPSDYEPGSDAEAQASSIDPMWIQGGMVTRKVWDGKDMVITVGFSGDGRVLGIRWLPYFNRSWWQNFMDRLRL